MNDFWSVVLERKKNNWKKLHKFPIIKNRGSTQIYKNLVGVHPRNIHTKFATNPCICLVKRDGLNKDCLLKE